MHRLTKMGYADNAAPQFVIPTAISFVGGGQTMSSSRKDDMYNIGYEATTNNTTDIRYPIRHGQIDNWSDMELYWLQSVTKYLRAEPEKHHVLLTEPPMNAPENREYTAEIWFETFGVKGLYIGVQAVLALAASWSSTAGKIQGNPLTGTVIDSGDGVTHIIPVVLAA